jgi:hypothetical protein
MAAAATVGGLAAYAWSAGSDESSVDPATVARTDLPGLEPATGEPELAGIDTASPAPGEVVQVTGPFDDRFTTDHLTVADGAVSGRLLITSDVSDVLELQVLAGFYDEHGTFLGTGRVVYHLDEGADHSEDAGPPSELQEFHIVAPRRYADQVAAATIGVPVLVNE